MSELLKTSGKKFVLTERGGWEFTPRPGGWMIAENASGVRFRIAGWRGAGKAGFSIGGKLFHGEILEEQRGSLMSGGGDSDLTAQFPGKVRKVLVADGAEVSEGAPLILIEAMKMEFTIKAPGNGKIRAVLVQEGQQLSPGDRFFEFEGYSDG